MNVPTDGIGMSVQTAVIEELVMVDHTQLMGKPSDWRPITDEVKLACLGKYGEELAEFAMACIEGHDEPLMLEVADVLATTHLMTDMFLNDFDYNEQHQEHLECILTKDLLALCALRAMDAANAVFRCIIQGENELEPSTYVPNLFW